MKIKSETHSYIVELEDKDLWAIKEGLAQVLLWKADLIREDEEGKADQVMQDLHGPDISRIEKLFGQFPTPRQQHQWEEFEG